MKKKIGGVIKDWQLHKLSFTKEYLDEMFPGENLLPLILSGTVVNDPLGRWKPGFHMRTSLICKIDKKNKVIETRNTVYKLAGKENSDVLPEMGDGILGIFY